MGDLCGSYTTPKQIEPVKCTPSLDRSSFLHFLGAMKWEFEMQLWLGSMSEANTIMGKPKKRNLQIVVFISTFIYWWFKQ